MALVNSGRDYIAAAIIGNDTGTAGQALTTFNNANAALGVGNGTTAFAVGQTDLQGASKTRKAMLATFPSLAANVITFKSTFGTADANYAWEEVGVFNSSSLATGSMLSRNVATLMTKTAAVSVDLTHTLTLAV